MRKGRFSGLNGDSAEPMRPLGWAEVLLFDLRRPVSEDHARIAEERARGLAVSLPFLAASHLVWSIVAIGALAMAGGEGAALVALPLAIILLLDIVLWRGLRGSGTAPHAKVRRAAICALAGAPAWAAAIFLIVGAGGSFLAKASLVAAIGAGIAVFFPVPLLLILSCLLTFAGMLLIRSEAPLVAMSAIAAIFFAVLSLTRARDLVFAAEQRLRAEWEAKKARRFVTEFEDSGRGWFWETNSDGAVTYLSDALATHLGLAAGEAAGRRFEELLLVKDPGEGEEARRTLGFHLSARFPFSDVIVRAPSENESWWALSGSPSFDDYGRFMGFRGIGTNLSEERRTEAERSKLARYDSLTGLANRALMRATLDEALANAAARHQGCALMMIDLDRFKQVNDTLGHPVGDKLLKQVAERLKETVGQDGQVGRLGGDEFEAILPGIAEEARLSDIAARMIASVSSPYLIDGHKVEIGTSVGIAIARPGKAYAAALVKDADLALYAAKAAGRGTFRFFAPQMHDQAAERQMLENDLRDAAAKDQLRLLFQPIVDSVSEEPVAFEALLRWQHPTRGLLLPAMIIPLAEECGLMPRIGAWVLRTACAEAAKWPDHVRLAVNLSAGQCADQGLPSLVTSALAASGVAPDRLELEIGEDAFPTDGLGNGRVLARLKSLGVRLALDNFGTGQSGLSHLREAPLDKIKIDRSFVRGAEEPGSRNAAIIRAIVVLGESLGMETTAEGAETLEELALIRRLGCSQVQGFLFGKPMPALDALRLAQASRPTCQVIGFSRPPRHRLIRNGVLHCNGEELAVRLRNISEGGAMIECDQPMPADTQVRLDLDEAGRLDAEVRWCEEGRVGLKFAKPFELRRLSHPRPGAGGLKMLTPIYLAAEAPAAPVGPSVTAKKPARRR